MTVVKRDGEIVEFDFEKIRTACLKAGFSIEKSNMIYPIIAKKMSEQDNKMHVEEIQDLVVKFLRSESPEVAEKYQDYRMKRTQIRNNRMNKVFHELINVEKSDVANENGNMNSETPSGMVSKFGFESSKEFTSNNLLSKFAREHHLVKDFHIHDLDFFATKCEVCHFTDLSRVLKEGIETVNGGARPAKRISSAIRLVAISLQTSQNEQMGGQAIHSFDYALAPYVKLTCNEIFEDVKKEFGIKESWNIDFNDKDYEYVELNDDMDFHHRIQQIVINRVVKECKQGMKGLVHDLNIMASRTGNQVIFSSLNFGTDDTPEGRLIIRTFLEAVEDGVGTGRTTAIFPISIFRVKAGISRYPEDKNYDLYQLAKRVTSKRFFPNFINLDASFNKNEIWVREDYQNRWKYENSSMGCRSRVFENINGEKSGVSRGVSSFTSINLVRLAIDSKLKFDSLEDRIDYFFNRLDIMLFKTKKQLLERFEWQQSALSRQFPYVAKQLKQVKEETMRESLKNSTLGIGFIGLAETLVALIGKHHGESEEAQELGLKIVKHMYEKAIVFKNEHQLNFSILATPAEGLSHSFTDADRKIYGIIEGVTDRGYYTNSSHVPVYYNISAFDKIRIEAPYHKYELGGHIGYIEMDGNPEDNLEAMDKIIEYALDMDMGYIAINHEDNYCSCGHHWVSKSIKNCPKCGAEVFREIERITGYLVGTLDKWNRGKKAEKMDRVAHV